MNIYQIVFLLVLTASGAVAKIKVPSSVFSADQLEEASAKAKKDGKALAFVYTDAGST